MSSLIRALLVCALLFHATLSWATTEVALEQVATGDNLVTDMLGLENADLGAQQLAQALRHPEWQPLNRHPELVEAPRQQSTLWLQARLSNGSGKPLQRWLELSPWRLSEVDAWLLDPHSGTVLEQIAVGRNIPVLERRIKSTRALVPVEMAAGETVLLVLRIHSASRPFLEITSWDPIDFKDDEVQRFQLHTVALTVILTLVAVLLLQLNMRYFLLSLWMLTLFFFESEKEGFISYLFAYSFQDYAKNLLYTSWVLASGFFLAVSVYLLGLNRHWLWRKVLPVVAAVILVYSGLTFVLDGSDVRNLGSAIDLSLYALWLLMVPAALRQKREYQYWLLAVLALWWVTSVFILLGYIFNFYYTSVLAASKVVVKIGVIFALLLLYAHQKRMYEQSLERQIRQRERQQRQHLEQAVIERTRELHEAMRAAH
ncbi:MAG: 7TMR-DISMED2 domain-containing protein [Marinobacterium sp.]